jgi:hypothetical protein
MDEFMRIAAILLERFDASAESGIFISMSLLRGDQP